MDSKKILLVWVLLVIKTSSKINCSDSVDENGNNENEDDSDRWNLNSDMESGILDDETGEADVNENEPYRQVDGDMDVFDDDKVFVHGIPRSVITSCLTSVSCSSYTGYSECDIRPAILEAPFISRLAFWEPTIAANRHFPQCPRCHRQMQFYSWTFHHGREGRLMFSENGLVLLLTTVYYCTTSAYSCPVRYVFGTNDELMRTLGVSLPCIFGVRSGFTSSAAYDIQAMFNEGLSLRSVQRIYKSRYYSNVRVRFANRGNEVLPDCIPVPGKDLIKKIYVALEKPLEEHHMQHMLSHRAERYVAADHTFKVPSVIFRHWKKEWRKEFKALFIILNEYGQVMQWSLTPNTRMEETCAMWHDILQRIPEDAIIIVDNCCQVAQILNGIIPGGRVKLDIWHAVDRIAKSIPKKKKGRQAFLKNLSLCIKEIDPVSRCTREPRRIQADIAKLISVTKKSPKKIITSLLMKKLKNLNIHIRNGCLSHLPAKAGTNRNEGLHRFLRQQFRNHQHLSHDMALLYLNRILSRYNCDKSHCPPMLFSNLPQSSGQKTMSTSATATTEKSSSDTAEGGKQCIMSDEDEEEFKVRISTETENFLTYARVVSEQFGRPKDMISCLANSIDPKFRLITDPYYDHSAFTAQRLVDYLDSIDRDWVEVPGDGDCFFTSVAMAVRQHLRRNNFPAAVVQYFQNMHIQPGIHINDLVRLLRQITVTEWTQNRERYAAAVSPVLSDAAYELEANRFLFNGYFSGPLADTMVTALTNALRIPLTVLTQDGSRPSLGFVPERQITTDSISPMICLIYDRSSESGHYDVALQREGQNIPADPGAQLEMAKCSCGRTSGRKTKVGCAPTLEYLCRCPCYRGAAGCSRHCSCRNCGNPNGRRLLSNNIPFPTSSRTRHATREALRPNTRLDGDFAASLAMKQFCFLFGILRAFLSFVGAGQLPSPELLFEMHTKYKYMYHSNETLQQLRFEDVRYFISQLQRYVCTNVKFLPH